MKFKIFIQRIKGIFLLKFLYNEFKFLGIIRLCFNIKRKHIKLCDT